MTEKVFPESIQKLIDLFSKFPTIGRRTATRFAFHLSMSPNGEVKELINAIIDLKKKTRACRFCFDLFELNRENGDSEICGICSNPSRKKNILCIVEKETDLASLEQIKRYKGLYFVLGGALSPLKKESLKKIRIKELEERIKAPEKYGVNASLDEIIIATNFTLEGENTALYLENLLKKLGIKTTRLAKGMPTGAELEYLDEETLSSALEGRKQY